MIGWWDCSAGASGDMLLGALVDLGVPLSAMQSAVDSLATEPIQLTAAPTTRHGLAATKVEIKHDDQATHRSWADIRVLIARAELPEAVSQTALAAFGRLARAEAAAHGVDEDTVHFHEVGALDAIADIVGVCAGVAWLAEHRGLAQIMASPVAVGSGQTRGSHGGIPIPAPAVLRIFGEAQAPIVGALPHEACTPTGAALIATHADSFGPLPAMTVDAVGVGAGTRDPDEVANVVRFVLGETAGAAWPGRPTTGTPMPGRAVMLECNIDDLDPRVWPAAIAALLKAGASDAWLTPILMKKGRPAHTLHVLCAAERVAQVSRAVFTHTSTIGLRSYEIGKQILRRQMGEVWVRGHRVGIKQAWLDGEAEPVNTSVEYEDVAAAAVALDLSVKQVLDEATAAAQDAQALGSDPS